MTLAKAEQPEMASGHTSSPNTGQGAAWGLDSPGRAVPYSIHCLHPSLKPIS